MCQSVAFGWSSEGVRNARYRSLTVIVCCMYIVLSRMFLSMPDVFAPCGIGVSPWDRRMLERKIEERKMKEGGDAPTRECLESPASPVCPRHCRSQCVLRSKKSLLSFKKPVVSCEFSCHFGMSSVINPCFQP